jgi:isopenicillin N synthase-like dioxygenase
VKNDIKFTVGEVNESDNGNYGASAHSDYGMITLLATDGTPGLQVRFFQFINFSFVLSVANKSC